MKSVILATAIVALVALACAPAQAALLVDDDFDSYESQEQFEAVWMPIGTLAPISGVFSQFALSSPNAIENPSTGSNGRYHNEFSFAPTPVLGIGDQLIWSFDFYDKLPVGNPQNNFATLQTAAVPGSTPAGQAISMGLRNNQVADDSGGNRYMASILGYSHAAVDPNGGPSEHAAGTTPGAFFKLNDTGAGGRGENEAWHRLMVILTTPNGTTVDHQYYVDDVLAETVTGAGPIQQYSVIRLGSGLSHSVGAFFDNMRLEFIPVAVPEAGAFAAVGLAGVLLGGAVWIRKKRLGP